jgi:raffinose/stachyose/melibiose transport system substrate-binding protein
MRRPGWMSASIIVMSVVFAAATVYALWYAKPERLADGRTVVRIGHYILQPSTRAALQEVIAEYERRRPDVRVIEMAVPERVYAQLLRAQLVGRSAPDIIHIGGHFLGMDELRTRYFAPITRLVERPNPYNVGTPLEGRPWRETFIDNMVGPEAYSVSLRHYYGVPSFVSTVRVHYNQRLLQQIAGLDHPPEDFEEFLALGQAVHEYNRQKGRNIAPLAGSRLNALFFMAPLFGSVTQKLTFDISPRHSLHVSGWDYAVAHLNGAWDFQDPRIHAGFELMREVSQYVKPGFLQLTESDGIYQFLQEQVLMLVTMGTNSGSIRQQASFPVGVGKIPTPGPEHPRYGEFVLGPVTEAPALAMLTFGVSLHTPHQTEAFDFLQFLGSQPGSEIFSRISGFMPVVEGVAIPEQAVPFAPVLLGYPGRFFAEMFGWGDGRNVLARHLHRLFEPAGSADTFIAAIEPEYAPAMRRDLARHAAESRRNVAAQEVVVLGRYALAPTADNAGAVDRELVVSSQNWSEARWLQLRYQLQQWTTP